MELVTVTETKQKAFFPSIHALIAHIQEAQLRDRDEEIEQLRAKATKKRAGKNIPARRKKSNSQCNANLNRKDKRTV